MCCCVWSINVRLCLTARSLHGLCGRALCTACILVGHSVLRSVVFLMRAATRHRKPEHVVKSRSAAAHAKLELHASHNHRISAAWHACPSTVHAPVQQALTLTPCPSRAVPGPGARRDGQRRAARGPHRHRHAGCVWRADALQPAPRLPAAHHQARLLARCGPRRACRQAAETCRERSLKTPGRSCNACRPWPHAASKTRVSRIPATMLTFLRDVWRRGYFEGTQREKQACRELSMC